jgi:hypothetical protein
VEPASIRGRAGWRPSPKARGSHLAFWTAAILAALVAALLIFRGEETADALEAFPAIAAGGAIAVQLAWLFCRGEAWRLSLNAMAPASASRGSVHGANGIAFLVGAFQAVGTVPARALSMRRIARDDAPTFGPLVVSDLPILLLEGSLMAVLLLAAAVTAPDLPAWVAGLALGGAMIGIAGLVLARARLAESGVAVGLRVLGDRRRLPAILVLVLVMGALSLTRGTLVLGGFGLPDGFASAVAFVAALGVIGALPIGPTATPAAALAIFGTTDPERAALAGIAMAATSLIAVALYGALAVAGLAIFGRPSQRQSGSAATNASACRPGKARSGRSDPAERRTRAPRSR